MGRRGVIPSGHDAFDPELSSLKIKKYQLSGRPPGLRESRASPGPPGYGRLRPVAL
jgi:hypothetical protein